MPSLSATRRQALAALAGAALPGALSPRQAGANEGAKNERALVAITLDLEMSRNFPAWDATHWDYEKGNLNEETKAYATAAARRVKARGGVIHFFVVGRVLEQENVQWLQDLAAEGHPLGNHTYDHVYVKAEKPEEIQFRFQRSPWLIAGREPADVVRENIRLCTAAMKSRLKAEPRGFRTPGGFASGLADRPDVQQMLLDQGFRWVSAKYPAHPVGKPLAEPTEETLAAIVAAQQHSQPFTYPSGLVEVPMSPISDIGAFRTGRWKLEWFLEAVRRGVEWAIENRAAYDFLAHPSCLYVTDPDFRAIDLICDLVEKAGDRAQLADLDQLAARATPA